MVVSHVLHALTKKRSNNVFAQHDANLIAEPSPSGSSSSGHSAGPNAQPSVSPSVGPPSGASANDARVVGEVAIIVSVLFLSRWLC